MMMLTTVPSSTPLPPTTTTGSAPPTNNNATLPIEIIEEIAIHLHPHELHRLAGVSKPLNAIFKKPSDRLAKINLKQFFVSTAVARKWDPIRLASTLDWKRMSDGYKVALVSMHGFTVPMMIMMMGIGVVSEKGRELAEALYDNKLSTVVEMCTGTDVEAEDGITDALKKNINELDVKESSHLALRWLAAHGEVEVLKELMDSNKLGNEEVQIVVGFAFDCKNRKEQMMDWVLSLNESWKLKDTLIYLGCGVGYDDVVTKLLYQKRFTSSFDPNQAIVCAIESNSVTLIKRFLKFRSVRTRPILIHALHQEKFKMTLEVFRILLNDTRSTFTDVDYEDIFWHAAHSSSVDIMKYLVQSNRVHPTNSKRESIARAISLSSPEPLRYLLSLNGMSAKMDNYAPLVSAIVQRVSPDHVEAILSSTQNWRNITNFFKPTYTGIKVPKNPKCFDFLFAVACEQDMEEVAVMIFETGLVSNVWAFSGRAFLGAAEHGNVDLGHLIMDQWDKTKPELTLQMVKSSARFCNHVFGKVAEIVDFNMLSKCWDECFNNAAEFGRTQNLKTLMDLNDTGMFDFDTAVVKSATTMCAETLEYLLEFCEPDREYYVEILRLVRKVILCNSLNGVRIVCSPNDRQQIATDYLRVLLEGSFDSVRGFALRKIISKYWDDVDFVRDVVEMGVLPKDIYRALTVAENEKNYSVAGFLLEESLKLKGVYRDEPPPLEGVDVDGDDDESGYGDSEVEDEELDIDSEDWSDYDDEYDDDDEDYDYDSDEDGFDGVYDIRDLIAMALHDLALHDMAQDRDN
ncbi:hypothetical protein HDU76_012119 [Blyttiomyces sp. JEL0837]|nr:hypothetical protein HDU76_012119 [Blyttiomyces sp. JEL0837]